MDRKCQAVKAAAPKPAAQPKPQTAPKPGQKPGGKVAAAPDKKK